MSVASLDQNLQPSSFSNFGKIEIAGAGPRCVLVGAAPDALRHQERNQHGDAARRRLRGALGGDQPHVRGMTLWRKLQATARPLPDPASRVGKGLVQAPA